MNVWVVGLAAHTFAYLLGAIPSALWVTYWLARMDIRTLGDGNMGARNVAHEVGFWPAALVGVIDVSKSMLAVELGRTLGLAGLAQYTVGAAAVLGHDFPLFARFRGGQGMATIIGASLILLPRETLVGLCLFGAAYLLIRRFNLSAGLGLGAIPLVAWGLGQPLEVVLYPVLLLLTIPLKKWVDRGRVRTSQPPTH